MEILKHSVDMKILKLFAYLPYGIIREIIAYTGVKFKKRNGKYMGQIPNTDPRFALLLMIPKKKISVLDRPDFCPHCIISRSNVNLTQPAPFVQGSVGTQLLTLEVASQPTEFDERLDLHPSVYLEVQCITYINDPILGNRETIEYTCRIFGDTGDIRCEKYEYYKKDTKYDDLIAKWHYDDMRHIELLLKIEEIKKEIKQHTARILNVWITVSMFTFGLVVQKLFKLCR